MGTIQYTQGWYDFCPATNRLCAYLQLTAKFILSDRLVEFITFTELTWGAKFSRGKKFI